MYGWFKKFCDLVDVLVIKIYVLRYFYVFMLIVFKEDLLVIKERLGYSCIIIILEKYGYFYNGRMNDVFKKLIDLKIQNSNCQFYCQ